MQYWGKVGRKTRKEEGGKGVVLTFSRDSSIHCCSIATMSFHRKKRGKKHMGAQGISKSVPSPSLNPSFHHLLHTLTHKHSSPRGCHVTDLKGEEFAFFSFPCVSKLTCRFTWQWARLSASVCACVNALRRAALFPSWLTGRTCLYIWTCLFALLSGRVRVSLKFDVHSTAQHRRGVSAAKGTVRHGA